MKIRSQLRLMLAATVASLCLVLGLAAQQLISLRHQFNEFQTFQALSRDILEIEARSMAVSRDDPIMVDSSRKDLKAANALISNRFDDLDQTLPDSKLKQQIAGARKQWHAYEKGFLNALKIASNDPTSALSIPDAMFKQYLRPAIGDLKKAGSEVHKRSDKASAAINRAMSNIVWMIALPLLAAIIVVAVIQGWVGRRLRTNIDGVSRAVDALMQGNLSQRLPTSHRDEIGQVCEQINGFVDHVVNLLDEIEESVEATRASSESLRTRSTSVTANAREQETRLNEIGSAMSDVETNGKAVADRAQQALEKVDDTRTLVRDSNQAGRNMASVLQHISSRIESSSQALGALEKELGEIGQVLDVIATITEQTNLLALNASIEAARAGEHGRGFAVVADEVRQLSQKTASSTTNIQALIRAIRDHTDQVLTATAAAREASREGVQSGDAMAELLARIDSSMTLTAETVAGMTDAIEDQSRASSSIVASMQEIERLSQATGADIGATDNAIGGLAEIANRLHQSMLAFRR